MTDYRYNRFTNKDKSFIKKNYFVILRETDLYYEICSKCTRHCWVISKRCTYDKHPIYLYHKHNADIEYYHLHWKCFTVQQAVKSIISHDNYVLNTKEYKKYGKYQIS